MTSSDVRLTKAQIRELKYLATVATARQHYANNYRPIVALRKLGFVDYVPGKFGCMYAITPSGLTALSNNEGN